MKNGIKNILAVYAQATADEVSAGMSWYQNAHDESATLHPDIELATGIVAALSPGLRWEKNIEAARLLINKQSLNNIGIRYTANISKASEILHGASPSDVLYRGERSGHKVRAFWQCLLNPLNWNHVCVDGHAFGIWSGERIPLDEVPNLARNGLYERISDAYAKAALTLDILPMHLQAITWVCWRRLVGVANGGTGHLSRKAA